MWFEASCPRPSCGLIVRGNGITTCGSCKALLCYKPSPRRRVLEFQGRDAWGWRPDPKGAERVHVDNGTKVVQECGLWVKLPGTRLTFPRQQDGRRTARTPGGWGWLDRYRPEMEAAE